MLIGNSLFTRDTVFNVHNSHYWVEENPKRAKEIAFQRNFSDNVWAGVLGDQLIGLNTFQGTLIGEIYLQYLQQNLPAFLKEVNPV